MDELDVGYEETHTEQLTACGRLLQKRPWFRRFFCLCIIGVWISFGYIYGRDLPEFFNGLSDEFHSDNELADAEADQKLIERYFDPYTINFGWMNLMVLTRDPNEPDATKSEKIKNFTFELQQACLFEFCTNPANHDKECLFRNVSGYYTMIPELRPFKGKVYLSDDRSTTSVIVKIRRGWNHDRYNRTTTFLQTQMDKARTKYGLHLEYTGEGGFLNTASTEVIKYMETADSIAFPLALFVVCVFIGPGGLSAVLTIGLTAAISLGLLVKVMYAGIGFVSFSPALFIDITVALSLDYTIFIFARYGEELRSGKSGVLAIEQTLFTAGKTICVSAVILGCSFIGAAVASNSIPKSIGLGAITIIASIMLMNITLIPAVLALCSDSCCKRMSACGRHGNPRPFCSTLTTKHALLDSDDMFNLEPSIPSTREIEKTSTWFRLARLARTHPLKVIGIIMLVTLPIACQCIRMRIGVGLECISPYNTPHAHVWQDAAKQGFIQGITSPLTGGLAANKGTGVPSSNFTEIPPACRDNNEMISDLAKIYTGFSVDGCSTLLAVLPQSCNSLERNGRDITPIIRYYCRDSCGLCATTTDRTIFSDDYYQTEGMIANALVEAGVKPIAITSVAFPFGQAISFKEAQKYMNSSINPTAFKSDKGVAYRWILAEYGGLDYTAGRIDYLLTKGGFSDEAYIAVESFRSFEKEVIQPAGYKAFLMGGPVIMIEVIAVVLGEAPLIMVIALLVCVVVLTTLAFRSLLMGFRLLLTIAVTVLLTMGCAVVVFQDIIGIGIYWIVAMFSIPVVIGLTLDYDTFLLSRIFEFRKEGYSTDAAIAMGLHKTGAVINVAGIVMVVAFASMLMMPVQVLQQMGFVFVFSALIDTFLVRTLLVPAIMSIGNPEWNWWPNTRYLPPITIGIDKAYAIEWMSNPANKQNRNAREYIVGVSDGVSVQ